MTKQNDQYDIVITGGRVMDPESGFDAVRNVGITGEKIDIITERRIHGKELRLWGGVDKMMIKRS